MQQGGNLRHSYNFRDHDFNLTSWNDEEKERKGEELWGAVLGHKGAN